jgi:TolB-like protein
MLFGARSPLDRWAPSRTLAVLPFDKDATTEDWFVDGVTNELTTIVTSWRDVQVIGRGTMSTYKGRAVDAREIAVASGCIVGGCCD